MASGGGISLYSSSNARIKFANSTTGTATSDGTQLYALGDNFHIENKEAGFIATYTSGLERMRIDSSGNVGIGTTSPTELLEIKGVNPQFVINGTSTTDAGIEIQNNGTKFAEIKLNTSAQILDIAHPETSGQISFSTGASGTERLRIDSSGRVGIGASNPQELLQVGAGANSVNGTLLLSSDAGFHNYIRFTNGGGTDSHYPAGIWYQPAGRMELRAASNATTSNAAQLVLASDGNVGIGSTSPLSPLDVVGSGDIVVSRFSNGTRGLAVAATSTGGSLETYNATQTIDIKTFGATGSDIKFSTNNTERLRIDSSGRLLIGTTSARTNFYGSLSSNLQIEGSGFAASSVYATNGNGAFILGRSNAISGSTVGNLSWQIDDGLSFKQTASISGAVDGTPGNNDTPGRIVFSTTADGASSPTERMRIDSSGNVGIGTSSPSDTLHLNDSVGYGLKITDSSSHIAVYRTHSDGAILKTASNHPLLFGTNDTERMRIDSSGNVKIGGTLPSAANISLNANGSAEFAGYLRNDRFTTKAGISLSLGGTDYAFAAYQDSLNPLATIGIDGSGTFAGDLGVGTTSPARKLHVSGSGTQQIRLENTAGTGNAELELKLPSHTLSFGVNSTVNYFSDSADLPYVWYHASGERMRIDSTGKVGIGVSSPIFKTDILSGTANTGANVNNPGDLSVTGSNKSLTTGGANVFVSSNSAMAADTGGTLAFTGRSTTSSTSSLVWANMKGAKENAVSTNANGYLAFAVSNHNAGGLAERMRIDSAGRVGIGTSPSNFGTNFNALQVHSQSGGNAYLALTNATTGNDASNHGFNIIATGNNATLLNREAGFINFSTSDLERMRIDSAGRVGIGTDGSQSAERLQVRTSNDIQNQGYAIACQTSTTNTSYQMRFINPNGAVGSITTASTATSFNTSSDYRLKENIVGLPEAITRVKQLQPKRFNFIVDPDTTVDGFLAHEAQTVVPEAITGTKDAVDDEGKPVYQGIDQSKLVPLLTAALQEAITKIETLEQRLTDAGL